MNERWVRGLFHGGRFKGLREKFYVTYFKGVTAEICRRSITPCSDIMFHPKKVGGLH